MPINKVWIAEGCIVCRACEVVCAAVFDVRDEGAVVRTKKFVGHDAGIEQAAADCPVKVIEFTTTPVRRATGRSASSRKKGARS